MPSVDRIIDTFGVVFSLAIPLGSRSMIRKHRGKERFPGLIVTYGLIEEPEKVAESSNSYIPDTAASGTSWTTCTCKSSENSGISIEIQDIVISYTHVRYDINETGLLTLGCIGAPGRPR